MKKETAIKILKWSLGLGIGALATYGIYVAYNPGKKSDVLDITGMVKYQIIIPFTHQNLVSNVYDLLLNYKHAYIDETVINDAANNPSTIILNIMVLRTDIDVITKKLITIAPDIKFLPVSNQK